MLESPDREVDNNGVLRAEQLRSRREDACCVHMPVASLGGRVGLGFRPK